MTDEPTAGTRLTLGEAIKELGFLPTLFAILIGGPSILSILQKVFLEHDLIEILQWIVDGYDSVIAILGAALDPLLQPLVTAIGGILNIELELDPIWRPIFALMLVVIVSAARADWNARYFRRAILYVLVGGLICLLGAFIASLSVSIDGWIAQLVTAAVPLALLLLSTTLVDAIDLAMDGRGAEGLAAFKRNTFEVGWGLAIIVPLLTGLLSWMFGDSFSVGIAVLGITLVLFGVATFALGVADNDRYSARAGLSIVGGFAAAALILIANLVLTIAGMA